MGAFASLGLFNMEKGVKEFETWGECMRAVIPSEKGETRSSMKKMLYFTKASADSVNRIMQAVDFLDLLSDELPFPKGDIYILFLK